MPLTDIRDLQLLAILRGTLQVAKDNLARAQTEVIASVKGKELEEAKQELLAIRGHIMEAEATIRDTALEHYDETGEKAPWPGVKIKLYTVVDYDIKEASAWVRVYMPSLLVFDHSAFEKATKAGLTRPVGRVRKEPRAQIARDLNEYLPVVAEPIQEGEETEQ